MTTLRTIMEFLNPPSLIYGILNLSKTLLGPIKTFFDVLLKSLT